MCSIPILVIIFNRPDYARKLYDILNLVKPSKLYIISDGARNPSEIQLINESRKIFNTITWQCEVKYNYADINLGIRQRIISGISWAFETENKLIILEDDCIPHLDFFPFCEQLLSYYEDDKRIMAINGCNLNPKLSTDLSESYFFSKYANSWGWATWKRAWNLFDPNLTGLENKTTLKNLRYSLPSRHRATFYWKYKLGIVKSQKINSWAFRWMASLWENNGLAIVPQSNLINNIGNDSRSTNTRGTLHFLNIKTSSLKQKIIQHPAYLMANYQYDQWIENSIYSKSLSYRIIWLFKKITFYM